MQLRRTRSLLNFESPGVDIHRDTPTEVLHTILLGIVKYFWAQTLFLIVQEKRFDIFQARLESISSDGLNIPRIMASYMCQYRGSLIGKHFKTIVQILPHIIYDLVPRDLLDTWTLMGRLTVLCWHTEIKNTDEYLVSNYIYLMMKCLIFCRPRCRTLSSNF